MRADFDDIDPGFRYLYERPKPKKDGKAGKPAGPVVPSGRVFDYAMESERHKRYQAAKASEDKEVQASAEEDRPDPEFKLYRLIVSLQGETGPNRVVEAFVKAPDRFRESAWACYSGAKSTFEEAPLVQLFNPQAAKGYALLKPTGTDRNDKTKEKWADPFLEWLRYRGFFRTCAGWFLGSKGEHVRVYTPIPKNISFRLFEDVAQQFRQSPMSGTAPKLDCRGVILLAKILISRSEALARPATSIDGVWITHYQSMGQAKAVTAIDRLAVPNWFDLQTKEDAERWLEALDEHDTVLRRLDDSISEELALLKSYRRFLEKQGAEAGRYFIDFLGEYGSHVFRQRGQGKWLLPQFKAGSVEAILGVSYKAILANEGFSAIAGAIRSATVSAQVAKKRGDRDYREIRYGAIPELRRKLPLGKEEFIKAVADFIADFNVESARRYEQGKSGFRISQSELAAFAELMDSEQDAQTVGALLCAMATCKLGQEAKEDSE
ncbi:MAG: hypothetical protein JSU00_09635 [Acidobacteria bacterium]|nr:hypothetical protein [Acidobacteriota bacterium]